MTLLANESIGSTAGYPQGPIYFKEGEVVGARTGSHKGPIPTSASSPAPTIDGRGLPIRLIVGASGERMWGVDPCGRPSGALHLSPYLKCIARKGHLYLGRVKE